MFESIGHGMTIASILERVKYTFEWQHFRVALSRVRLSKTFHCGIKLAVLYSWLTFLVFFLLQRTSCNCFYIAESSSDDVALIVWRLIWFHIYSCSSSAIFSPKSPITQCLSHDCFLFVTVIFLAKSLWINICSPQPVSLCLEVQEHPETETGVTLGGLATVSQLKTSTIETAEAWKILSTQNVFQPLNPFSWWWPLKIQSPNPDHNNDLCNDL